MGRKSKKEGIYVHTWEKAMAPHSSILAWGNPMGRGAWWAIVHGVTKEADTTE